MKNAYYLKVFVYTAVIFATVLTLWSFVNHFLPRNNAALGPDGAQAVFTPSSASIASGEQKIIKVRISPITATNTISAFDIFLKASGPIKMVSIGNNAAFKDPLIYNVTDTTAEYARIVHVNTGDPTDTIPTENGQPFIEFDLTVQGTGNGTGVVTFEATSDIGNDATNTPFTLENTTATFQVGTGGGVQNTPVPPVDTPVPGGGPQCSGELPAAFFSNIGYSASYSNHQVTFTGDNGKIVVYQANVPYWGPDWHATAAPIIVQGNTVEVPSGFFQVDFIKADAEVLASPAYAGENYSARGVLLAAVNGMRCTGGGGGGPQDTPVPPADTPVPGGGGGGNGGGTGSLACGVSCSKDTDCQSGFCNPQGFPLCPTSVPGQPLEGCQLIAPDPTLQSVCAPVVCKTDNGANCSCTVGGGGGGGGSVPVSMTLNLKLRMQGILKKPTNANADIFQFRLVGPSEVPLFGSFTPDADGAYTGTLNTTAAPGKYYILVKGPRHIQKKICVALPSETKPGTYHCGSPQIELKAGTNTLDFSQIALLVGDLPMQDGIVDSYDFSYVRQTLGSTKSSDLSVGDLNRDGIIDTQDVSLILQALAVKYDEE